MITTSQLVRHAVLAGGAALAVAAAPLAGADTDADPFTAGPFLSSCPAGEVADPAANGACVPENIHNNSTVLNPIDPVKTPLESGGITSAVDGNAGELPTVNGIPCNGNHSGGGSTGNCIGLAGEQPTYHSPHASVNGTDVTPPSSWTP